MKNLKNKLRRNQLTIGSWITLGDTAIAEIMSKSGFDWLAIDMEHSAITISEAQQLIQIIELSHVVPLVRVGRNDPYLIKRVMDAGAYGVIVPMVNTKTDGLNAVSAVKYPPLGKRSVGLGRAQGYGLEFEKYKEWINKGSIVIAQVEHIKAVENLKEILSIPEIDGTIVGPYDLSASLGIPGEFNRPEIKKAIKSYETLCKAMDKPMGFHVVPPSAGAANYYIKRGYAFLAVGIDTLYLGQKCKEVMSVIIGND